MQQEHASILSDPSIRLIYELPSDEMIQLMSSARALVFTTLGEGFGLPVIEAMKCGCPVITSSLTSLPEVGGDAALYVDPTEEEAIAEAIERVLTQDELVATMRAKGLEQSKRFTWHETAKKTVDVYRSIM
jgi:glycosyltransferase involved in cell wall biosynthesis